MERICCVLKDLSRGQVSTKLHCRGRNRHLSARAQVLVEEAGLVLLGIFG